MFIEHQSSKLCERTFQFGLLECISPMEDTIPSLTGRHCSIWYNLGIFHHRLPDCVFPQSRDLKNMSQAFDVNPEGLFPNTENLIYCHFKHTRSIFSSVCWTEGAQAQLWKPSFHYRSLLVPRRSTGIGGWAQLEPVSADFSKKASGRVSNLSLAYDKAKSPHTLALTLTWPFPN